MFKGRKLGSYELVERIGVGGMGEVWRAKHKMLLRPAAVKLIRPESLGAEEKTKAMTLLGRFEREAQATSALTSPNTIDLYDFGLTEDGTFYFAMELLDGLSLRSLVERFGPVPVERAVHFLRQACDSLAEAHHSGLIHRDIKPANLFTCKLGLKTDIVKVLDFGLVKLIPQAGEEVSQLTLEGVSAGSPAFMPPEVATATYSIDGRADLYSLGCVAYWLLTGQLVFVSDRPLQVLLAHIQQSPPSLSSRSILDIPTEFESIVMDCLKKNPDERPQTARELSHRLSEVPLTEPWTEERAEQWWALHEPLSDWRKPEATGEGAAGSPDIRPADQTDTPTEVPPPSQAHTPADKQVPLEASTSHDGDTTTTKSTPELDAVRDRILHELRNRFAYSHIDIDELDRLVEQAQYAQSERELEELLTPLPSLEEVETALVPVDQERDGASTDPEGQLATPGFRRRRNFIAFFSGVNRRGLWRPANKIRVVAVMGGVELDFRQAELRPGLTEVRCRCFLGGAKIIVPPELYVELDGFAFLGGFDEKGREHIPSPTQEDPWLHITGICILGGVEVVVADIDEPAEAGPPGLLDHDGER